MKQLKVIIDKNIPYIHGAFDHCVKVIYLPANEINAGAVRDADALIVRTRTQCNEQLLTGSNIKFIATATIGFDHIDTDYCEKNRIHWTNAPGCNALSVTQYLASALSFISINRNLDLAKLTIGIIGVGHVGSNIELLAKSFGMNVLLNDPPRERAEGSTGFVSLKEICEKADIITFHPLLNMSGTDKTYHLADTFFFNSLKRKPIIINASRGEVIETNSLLSAINMEKVSDIILDCWENEPNIDRELLKKCVLATPHIAGYSADGKANATQQSVQSLSNFFQLGMDDWKPENLASPAAIKLETNDFREFFLKTYDIVRDSHLLKKSPETFEKQRSEYWFRREPKGYVGNLPEGFQKKFGLFF